MKKVISILILLIFGGLIIVNAQKNAPKMTFDKKEHNFGTVKADEDAIVKFEFKNRNLNNDRD